ncbi:MAG: arginase [Gemmatimonadetes bacterium]|nr:arginase [Gemmatimonadota bacterium]
MSKVLLVGVPLDLGGNRRGVDMGPSALRITGLAERIRALGHDVIDSGDVAVPLPELCDIGHANQKYSGPIAAVCEDLCERVYAGLGQGRLPVTIGGDHSVAMGSVAGVARHFRERERRLGLLRFDAHGDMNTPASTNSGNVHGMSLAHLLGLGDERLASVGGFRGKVRAESVALIGVRDLDDREKKLVADSGVRVFTMKDIDQRGVSSVTQEAIDTAARGTDGIHVSLDIDVVDPSLAAGVGTPKKGGLTYREAHLCLEMVADSKRLAGIDLVEVNPILDVRNATAELGTELLLSALGKRIY